MLSMLSTLLVLPFLRRVALERIPRLRIASPEGMNQSTQPPEGMNQSTQPNKECRNLLRIFTDNRHSLLGLLPPYILFGQEIILPIISISKIISLPYKMKK